MEHVDRRVDEDTTLVDRGGNNLKSEYDVSSGLKNGIKNKKPGSDGSARKTDQWSAMTAAVSPTGASSFDTNPTDTPGQQEVRYKSSTVFHNEEVDEMLHELKELQKTSPDELKSLVFCKSNFAMAIVTREGCRIAFSNGSVYLDIPPNAIKEDQVVFIYRQVHIHLAGDTPEEPGPPPDFIAYAPTVRCGPSGTKLDIQATLQFGHCAVYDPAKGPSGLRGMKRKTETSPWEVMQPEQFDIAANSVKLRLDELSDCTLGFPLKMNR